MKYAVIADVHANLEGLIAVLADAYEQRCSHYAFLGDFVGYNADPKACLEIIRSLKAPCVKGNHDEYASLDLPLTDFNSHAAKAIEWTRKHLTEHDREWLRNLPEVLHLEHFTIVHATLNQASRWEYVFDKFAAASSFQFQRAPVCFLGHTHVPLLFVRDAGQMRGGTFSKLTIERKKQYFINAGSAGQPRDGIPKAAYVTYDIEMRSVELRRVDYDSGETQRKVRDAGLPLR
jgi:predicted phosphodiesterase